MSAFIIIMKSANGEEVFWNCEKRTWAIYESRYNWRRDRDQKNQQANSSNSQVIGCEDRLRNDLYCVGWGVKLYSIQSCVSIAYRLLSPAYTTSDSEAFSQCGSSSYQQTLADAQHR